MADGDVASSENDGAYIASLSKPSSLLPIARYRKELLYTVETNPITILIGQTGSGKTTQLPQFLEQAGWCADGKVIGVTQVRTSVFSQRNNRSHAFYRHPRYSPGQTNDGIVSHSRAESPLHQ